MKLIKYYASMVLALWVRPPLERLYGAQDKGPHIVSVQSRAGQWAGRTPINSGALFNTVSTNIVNSDSLIFTGIQVSSIVAVTSGGTLVVNSLVSGVSFALAWMDGLGKPTNVTAMWEIKRTS